MSLPKKNMFTEYNKNILSNLFLNNSLSAAITLMTINKKKDQQLELYLCNSLLLSSKKKKLQVRTPLWMNHKSIIFSKRSHTDTQI